MTFFFLMIIGKVLKKFSPFTVKETFIKKKVFQTFFHCMVTLTVIKEIRRKEK